MSVFRLSRPCCGGRSFSNPLTGYLMILRTRGRKSGQMRDAPLGYAIVGDHVYCIGRLRGKTHWLANVLADPKVEVILPGRAFSGIAGEVTDDRRAPERPAAFAAEHGPWSLERWGWANAWKMTPEDISRKCEGLAPGLRITADRHRGRPDDPGGWFWVVPIGFSAVGLLWFLRSRRTNRRRA